MIEINDDDVKLFLENGRSLPVEYYPDDMPHYGELNVWSTWETERFDDSMSERVKHWHRITSYIKRYVKLMKKRKQNPNYCNKNNYRCNITYIGNYLNNSENWDTILNKV